MQSTSKYSSILIVADTLFYPPRRNGFSVRYFPLICELKNAGYLVDIIVINQYRESYASEDINELHETCNRIDIINPEADPAGPDEILSRKITNIFHMLVPFGIPYHLINNKRGYIKKCIRDLLKARNSYDFGIGVGVGGVNADILLSLNNNTRPGKIICDFVDSAYLLRMREKLTSTPACSLIARLENEKTRQWEKSFCNRCDCIYISEEDAKTVGGRNAHVIPNCVVEDGYKESSLITLESPNIAFLGNMSYPPNIAACNYLIQSLLPAIEKRIPGIHLYIIGRSPDNDILRHSHVDNIHVTGEVENIWNYIRSADAFIFPMLSGAGLQNKVMEAMYAGNPVITSPIGNEGIGAKHGRDVYIANSEHEYIDYVEKAFKDGGNTGENARAFVKLHFSSESLAGKFRLLLSD